jgi:hypothetical protein
VGDAVSERKQPPELDPLDDDDSLGELRGVVIDDSSGGVVTTPEPPSGPAQPPGRKPVAGTS